MHSSVRRRRRPGAWWLFSLLLASCLAFAAPAWTSDQGDGTFKNPVLYADYPDPDIIRVGDTFYLATTTFVSMPAIEILRSKDLINWEIAGYAADALTFTPAYSLTGGSAYANGIWAPSLRYHAGTFYLIDNINNVGTVVFRATDPAGPWTMNHLNQALYDPGLMFDDDGTPLVYNGTAGHLSVARLDPELTTVLSNTAAFTTTQSSEGSHAYKIDGTYYVFGSVYGEYPVLLCSRASSPTGPFTTTVVCDNHTPWASPHQGGIVQLANGDWWGFSLVDAGAVGRDLWVGPVTWKDAWPYFGDPAAPSIPVTNPKPAVGASYPILYLPGSDNFATTTLGRQWQWNHNPDATAWSLAERPGHLRLHTQTAANLANARNTLTLRTLGPSCTGVVKIDTSHLAPGDRAGLCLFEQYYGYLAVYRDATGQRLVRAVNTNGSLTAPSEDVTDTVTGLSATTLWLKVSCDFISNTAQFSYSVDGTTYTSVGGAFAMHFTLTTFQGERFGFFNYNPAASTGWLDLDHFSLDGEVMGAATITGQPESTTAALGGIATFAVAASDATAYQWCKDGTPIAGATSAILLLTNLTADRAGTYTVVVTGATGAPVTSAPATLTLVAPPATRLVNIATRAPVGTDNAVLIGGFVIVGPSPKSLLIRASGPALQSQQITSFLADPKLELHDAHSIIATNDNWGDDPREKIAIQATASAVGAFAWDEGSKDAALRVTLPPGLYSVIVSGANAQTGTALLEVYDADAGASKLVNIATRAWCATGDDVAIGGFVVNGTAAKPILLRAVGPTLAQLGLKPGEVLADPTIEVHDALHDNAIVATFDNWRETDPTAIATTANRLGATALADEDQTSAAALLTLNPGIYSFIVRGKTGPAGIVLVETYDAD